MRRIEGQVAPAVVRKTTEPGDLYSLPDRPIASRIGQTVRMIGHGREILTRCHLVLVIVLDVGARVPRRLM